ncbi:MAG: hypothetical protein H6R13_3960 [Proteobacteria bacterium]|jgi:hypothetical protein|nr:hypothetical protein [Pseudomonadota bacterium]
MKKSFSKLFLAPLTVLVLASFALAPVAEARGGGGGHGGGGARAGGGGGGAKQVNNSSRDVRANNTRSTSVNNVSNRNTNINANKNVNVNVNNNNRGGCCNNGWDNDYHPVATAAAVTAAVVVTSAVVGSMVNTVPAGCVPVNYGGYIYQQCGSTWYQPQGSQYVVINPPY